jgi:hypothetical protein
MARSPSEASDLDDDFNDGPREPRETPIEYGMEPPVVAEEAMPKGTVQLAVQVDRGGRPADLGTVSARSTLTDVIRQHHAAIPHGGKLLFIPLSMAGKALRVEPFVRDVAPQHDAYRRLAEEGLIAFPVAPGAPPAQAGFQGVRAVPGSVDAAVLATITKATDAALSASQRAADERQRALDAREADLREREARVQNAISEVTQLRVSVREEQDKSAIELMREQQKNSAGGMEMMIAFMTKQSEAQAAAFQQQLTMNQANSDTMMTRLLGMSELERTRTAADAAAKAAADAHKLKELELDAKLRRENLKHEHDLELEKSRAKAELELEAVRSRKVGNPIADLMTQFGPMLTLLKSNGIDLKDVFGGMFSAGAGGGLLEAGVRAIEKVADTAVKMKELDLEYGDKAEAGGEQQVKVTMPDGTVRIMTEAQALQLQAQMQAQMAQQQQAAQPAQPQQIPVNSGGRNTPQGFVAPKGPQQAQAAAGASNVDPRVAKVARVAAMRLKGVLDARASIRDNMEFGVAVLTDLKSIEPVPAFEQYVRTVGFSSAMREVGTDPNLLARTVALLVPLQASGGFPADIPLEK